MKRWFFILTSSVLLQGSILLFAGCGKDKAERPEPGADEGMAEAEPADDFQWAEDLFDAAYEALSLGRTNEAIAVFTRAVEDPELDDKKPMTFGMLTRFLLSMEMRAEARERLNAMLDQDAAAARNALYEYYENLSRSGDHREMNEWTDVLLEKELPEELRLAALRWKLQALSVVEDDGNLSAEAMAVLDAAADRQVSALADELARGLLKRNKTQPLLEILDALKARRPEPPGLDRVQADIRTQIAMQVGDLAEAEKQFRLAAKLLPDAHLARLLRTVTTLARRGDQDAFAERVCLMILEECADKPRSREGAARMWMSRAKESGSPGLIAERMEFLMERELAPRTLYSLFVGHFYATIDAPEALRNMMDIGDRLLAKIQDEEGRGTLRTYLLDGGFVANNYALALEMLSQGIPGRDETWHALAQSKVLAHQALEENRSTDAVKHFRDFMEKLKTSADSEETVDPASGVVHTREMILGRNAGRIGGILDGIGEEEAAREAYSQAREYYQDAMEKIDDPDSESSKLAARELAAVPAL